MFFVPLSWNIKNKPDKLKNFNEKHFCGHHWISTTADYTTLHHKPQCDWLLFHCLTQSQYWHVIGYITSVILSCLYNFFFITPTILLLLHTIKCYNGKILIAMYPRFDIWWIRKGICWGYPPKIPGQNVH